MRSLIPNKKKNQSIFVLYKAKGLLKCLKVFIYHQSFSALKKFLALALSAQTEILSAALAQFFGCLALSLVYIKNLHSRQKKI